jgi:diaminopimelate decarboxylase
VSTEGLFPLTARANSTNHLEIGGCDLVHLAREYGTPLYVFDDVTLHGQAVHTREAFRARWPDSTVLYATKAYFSPFLARLYRDLALGVDVTSEGEMEIARRADFPPDKIYLHGNNKTHAEIRAALTIGVEHFVVDNLDEIPLIAAIAPGYARSPRLLIRLSPDIDPHTHRYLTTGIAGSKFGLSIGSGAATRAYEAIRRYPELHLVGLHVHIGSQIFEAEAIIRAMMRCLDLAAEWRERFGFTLRELNLGGGWGVAYAEDQKSVAIDGVAEEVCAALKDGLAARGLPSNVRLLVEPGRALIARAGIALYRIGSIKQISEARTFAAIDGGMGDNIRPALYGARYAARVANKFDTSAARSYAIAGRYCEQGDILIECAALPELETGDLLAVPAAGAYQLPMASNYNLIPRPAVLLVREGQAQLLRRRETIEDMLACDVV